MQISEKDIKKYLKVRDNFENVRQLQNYNLTFQKENYFWIVGTFHKNNMKSQNNIIRAVLSYNENIIKLKNQRKKIKKKYKPLDCGHLLAVELINYLNICDMCKKELVVSECNLFPQFPRANRNKKGNIGQARFENWLRAYIENNKTDKIYYEVEKIYRDNSSKNGIPIGTRLLAYKNNVPNDEKLECKPNKELKLPFHVFIPNYEIKSDNIDGFKDEYCTEDLERRKIDIYHDACRVLKQ